MKVLKLDVDLEILHFTLIYSKSEIFLGEEPFHELRKYSSFAVAVLEVTHQGLGACKVLLFLLDLDLESCHLKMVFCADLGQFFIIKAFLDDLYGFLTDVVTNVLTGRTFKNWLCTFESSFYTVSNLSALPLVWALLDKVLEILLVLLVVERQIVYRRENGYLENILHFQEVELVFFLVKALGLVENTFVFKFIHLGSIIFTTFFLKFKWIINFY